MGEQRYRWKGSELREQAAVIEGKQSPTKVLVNATYLHSYFREWVKGNIWINGDRIVYAGERLPDRVDGACEVVDCRGYVLVPGYIEPHVHPFQLYNPRSFARYAAARGTTTLVNDNLFFLLHLNDDEALLFLQQKNTLPTSMYWWCRFDGQTELEREDEQLSNVRIKRWLDQETVLQGGELTSWPRLVSGDDIVLYWMQEAKRRRRKIEGHFPGASEKTLVKMALFGVDGDHEAMTGKEVRTRLWHGYTVTLRHSSIRPDLPVLLDRYGLWLVNTMLKGFSSALGGLASSYSNTGDLVLIGKHKEDMLLAFRRMKEIGGGLVLAENGEIVFELPLGGMMSALEMESLIDKEKEFIRLLRERGYRFEDPVYSLFFLQSTHLPYVRITQRGIYDVMHKTVLFPSIMR